MVPLQGVNISWHSHFQMLQSAGREIFQYFGLSVTSLWGSWEAEDANGGSKQLQKQWSACRWPCASMWSTRPEVRCYVILFWINRLASLCVCVCAQMGSCMVFFSWRCLLWFLLNWFVTRRALCTDLFTAIFLRSCATCSTLLRPACCNGTTACPSPHRMMTWLLVPCCWCSSWLLSLGPWACVPLGKGSLCMCPHPPKLTWPGLCWPLTFA